MIPKYLVSNKISTGQIECEQRCCFYSNKRGKTVRVFPGKSFSDGCNRCKCSESGVFAGCTRRACPRLCAYKNWELHPGYAAPFKGPVKAFYSGCKKMCKCKLKKNRATVLKCRKGCIEY